MASGVADAAGGDHRHVDGAGDGADQGEGPHLRVDVSLEKHAAMAAGLGALGDDRIDAASGKKRGLAQRRRRARHLAPNRLDAR